MTNDSRVCTKPEPFFAIRALESRVNAPSKRRWGKKREPGGVTRSRPKRSDEDYWLEAGAYNFDKDKE